MNFQESMNHLEESVSIIEVNKRRIMELRSKNAEVQHSMIDIIAENKEVVQFMIHAMSPSELTKIVRKVRRMRG